MGPKQEYWNCSQKDYRPLPQSCAERTILYRNFFSFDFDSQIPLTLIFCLVQSFQIAAIVIELWTHLLTAAESFSRHTFPFKVRLDIFHAVFFSGFPSASKPFVVAVNFYCAVAYNLGLYGQVHAR